MSKFLSIIKTFVKSFARRSYRWLYVYFNDETTWLHKRKSFRQWKVGEYSYGGADGSPHLLYGGETVKLEIGNFCSFAQDTWIMLGGNHRIDWVTTYPFALLFKEAAHIKGHPSSKGNVIIGNDVWVGLGAIIMSNVTIGDGAVIGSRSVVTKDVPPYAVVAGNPARVVNQRFSEAVIKELLEMKWWNWPMEKIRSEIPNLLSDDINRFLDHNR